MSKVSPQPAKRMDLKARAQRALDANGQLEWHLGYLAALRDGGDKAAATKQHIERYRQDAAIAVSELLTGNDYA